MHTGATPPRNLKRTFARPLGRDAHPKLRVVLHHLGEHRHLERREPWPGAAIFSRRPWRRSRPPAMPSSGIGRAKGTRRNCRVTAGPCEVGILEKSVKTIFGNSSRVLLRALPRCLRAGDAERGRAPAAALLPAAPPRRLLPYSSSPGRHRNSIPPRRRLLPRARSDATNDEGDSVQQRHGRRRLYSTWHYYSVLHILLSWHAALLVADVLPVPRPVLQGGS